MAHLEQNPPARRHDVALFERALALFQRGRLAAAGEAIRALLADEPSHAQALHLMGVVLSQQGELNNGLRFLDAALQVEGQSAFIYNSRANVLVALRRFAEALASFDK